MRRHMLIAAALAFIVASSPGLAPERASAKTKPKSRSKVFTVGGPSIQKFQLTILGTYTATDGFGLETGTISVPKLLLQVVTYSGQTVTTGTGTGRVTGTLETLRMSPKCKTPANGLAVLQFVALPMLSSSPPTTIPENPPTEEPLSPLGAPRPPVPPGKVGFSVIAAPSGLNAVPGQGLTGPSVPCGPSPGKLVFVGAMALATVNRATTSPPFLIFSQAGEKLLVQNSEGPLTYDLTFTLVRLS